MEANIGGPAGISNDENVLDADHASLYKLTELVRARYELRNVNKPSE